MGSLPETYNDPNASVHKTKQRHSEGVKGEGIENNL